VTPPSDSQQLEFLANIQRLLSEGQFVATYKYALLLALADIAVEVAGESSGTVGIETRRVAEKFIQYYWRQCIPYEPRGTAGRLLRQNNGRRAAVLRHVLEARKKFHGSLAAAKQDATAWSRLVQSVDSVVRGMPLWKLQTVGRQKLDFLYANRGRGTTIELRPGVAYCLRRFHGLIGDLVRGAWVRFVRRSNHDLLGTTTGLAEFLFGSERADLTPAKPVLREIQCGGCFYCKRPVRVSSAHVDHFVPWSRYPVDLGHNFVLAHAGCNTSKSDHLAAAEFLNAWVERNQQHGDVMEDELGALGIVCHLPTSARVTTWAYSQVDVAGGLTWRRKNTLVQLPGGWERRLLELVAGTS
jgi:hypothetical protein